MHILVLVAAGAGAGLGWIAVSYGMEPLFPMGDWRWFLVAAAGFSTAGAAFLWQRRQDHRKAAEAVKAALASSKDSHLGPEVRTSDTTTYREQPDGSRVVTQTTIAKPVRLEGLLEIRGLSMRDTVRSPE